MVSYILDNELYLFNQYGFYYDIEILVANNRVYNLNQLLSQYNNNSNNDNNDNGNNNNNSNKNEYEKIKEIIKSLVKKQNSTRLYSLYYFKYYELIEKDDNFKGLNNNGFLGLNTIGILNKIDNLIIDFRNNKINIEDIIEFIINFLNGIKWKNWKKNIVLLNKIRNSIFQITNNKESYEKSIKKLKESLDIKLYNKFRFPFEWNSILISLTIEPMKSNQLLIINDKSTIDWLNHTKYSKNGIVTPILKEFRNKIKKNLISFENKDLENYFYSTTTNNHNKNNNNNNNNNDDDNNNYIFNYNKNKNKNNNFVPIFSSLSPKLNDSENIKKLINISNPNVSLDIKNSLRIIFESIREFNLIKIQSIIFNENIDIFSHPFLEEFSKTWNLFNNSQLENLILNEKNKLETIRNYLIFWLSLNPIKDEINNNNNNNINNNNNNSNQQSPHQIYQNIINFLFKLFIKTKGITIIELIEIKNQIKNNLISLEHSVHHSAFYLHIKSPKFYVLIMNNPSLLINKIIDSNIFTFEFIFGMNKSFDSILETLINCSKINKYTLYFLININEIEKFKKYFPIFLTENPSSKIEILPIGVTLLKKLINNTTNKEYIKLSIKYFIDKVTIAYKVGKRVYEYLFGHSILANNKELISYIINQYDIIKIPDGFNYWNNYPMIEYIFINHPNVDVSPPFQYHYYKLPFLSKSIPIFDILLKYKPSLFKITNDNLKFANSYNDTFILNYYFKKGYLDKDKNEIYKIKLINK
ncbi:hypothetical protein ACTFIR_003424 [Dictyostelium discoideum]